MGFSVELWHLPKLNPYRFAELLSQRKYVLQKVSHYSIAMRMRYLQPDQWGFNAIDEIERKVEVDKLYSQNGIEPVYLISGKFVTVRNMTQV